MILRANDIDTLILYGIATSGVALSTLVEAADADYRVAVVGDCRYDRLASSFPRSGDLLHLHRRVRIGEPKKNCEGTRRRVRSRFVTFQSLRWASECRRCEVACSIFCEGNSMSTLNPTIRRGLAGLRLARPVEIA